MGHKTIDFGIDLGTTNSEIAYNDNGQIRVFENYLQEKYTPSVVRITPKGEIMIGRKAYERLVDDPENTVGRFKRWMGTQQVKIFKTTSRKMTAEELSAEVLKDLIRTAKLSLPDEQISAVVITVPCNFESDQCEATIKAANLAGIRYVPLLQEPIAASIAYGFMQNMPKGYWAIYDLGGGTFDVAIMSAKEGRLSVVENCGDNYLGGTDFDWLVVQHVIYQALQEQYNLPDLGRENKEYESLNARAKASAEKAKIELSKLENTEIEIYSGANRLIDKDGKEIEISIPVKRCEYEKLIQDYVERTVVFFQQALKNQNLDPNDITQLILVGGPTLTPYIRKRLKDEFNISTDYKIDPLTIVAQGAAVFASTQFKPDDIVARDRSKIFINLKYVPMTTESETFVGGNIEEADGVKLPSDKLHVQISRSGGDWQSGIIEVKDKTFITIVQLREKHLNTFHISLFDQTGNKILVEPDVFSITQGISIADPPITRSLGVELEDGSFDVILSRGTSLPARSKPYSYYTTHSVRPGEKQDILYIHVKEGESTLANRNRHVGTLQISGEKVKRPIAENTKVEIILSLDQSRRATAEAYIEVLDQKFKEVLKDKVSPAPDPSQLSNILAQEEKRFIELKEKIENIGEPSLSQKLDSSSMEKRIEEIKAEIKAAGGGDQDAVEKADRRLKDLQILLDPLDYLTRWPLVLNEFNEIICEAEEAAASYGNDDDKDQLNIVKREASVTIENKDAKKLKKLSSEGESVKWNIWFRQDGFWVAAFQGIKTRDITFINSNSAEELIKEGDMALQRQDLESLKSIMRQLWDLMPSQEQKEVGKSASDSGIRRPW